MRSPPVDLRQVRHLLLCAWAEADSDTGAALQCLNYARVRLGLYRASPQRDAVMASVQAAIDADGARMALVGRAISAVNDWAVDLSTRQEASQFERETKSKLHGARHGVKAKRDAADRQAEWIHEARKMLKRNPRRTPADMARTLAAEPGETASAGWIAKVLRKTL